MFFLINEHSSDELRTTSLSGPYFFFLVISILKNMASKIVLPASLYVSSPTIALELSGFAQSVFFNTMNYSNIFSSVCTFCYLNLSILQIITLWLLM